MPVPNSPISQRAAWHAARVESLRRADGWLTLVGLDFLRDGSWSVGNGSGATFRYANCTAAQIGRFEVAGDAVRFVPTPSAAVTIERGAVGEPLIADDKGAPSVVVNATMTFTLVRRNGTLALRIGDHVRFLNTLVGTQGIQSTDGVHEYVRKIVASRFARVLPEVLSTVLDLAAQYQTIEVKLKEASAAIARLVRS